jgi:hypothetical protein
MEQSRPSLSRREFAVLSTATAGALLSPATAGGRTVPETNTTDVYQFLLGRVEDEYGIPTLVTFADESGFAILDDIGVEYWTHTDEVAARADLTPEQATTVIDADVTERVEYSPGAHPFWKLDAYDDGVFPDAENSADFIAYDEAQAGLDHLEQRHADRLNVESIGTGPGHENVYEGSNDPQDLWAIELTENVDDRAAFEEKEKLVFGLSIHGDERAGMEAGLRFVEAILDGDRPDIESSLDEFALIFVSPNPDGWVVRERIYENPTDPPDFRRFNGTDNDPNRQYPTTGMISPRHFPAEPDGSNLTDDRPGEIDADVPEQITEQVPDTLSIIHHLRTYENVEYFLDLHGMYGHQSAVLSLDGGGGSPGERAEHELLNRAMRSKVQTKVGTADDWAGAFELAAEDTEQQWGCDYGVCRQPEEIFGYGTAMDTIGYSVTGGFDIWAALPEDDGGLGATSLTTEIVFSNSVRRGMTVPNIQELTAFHVAAYQAMCEATIEFAVGGGTETTIKTDGRSTAYVPSDSVTSAATELPYFEQGETSLQGVSSSPTDSTLAGSGPAVDASPGGAQLETARLADTASLTGTTNTVEIPDTAHTVELEVRTAGQPVETMVYDSEGRMVRHDDARNVVESGGSQFTFVRPGAGEWTVETRTLGGSTDVEIRTTTLQSQSEYPDPKEVLGYRQRDYQVTPFAAFETLDEFANGPVDPLTVEEVRNGALIGDGELAYDNLVVNHTDGLDEAYRSALETYVEAGGNLVLTDSALELAASLDVAGLGAVEESDVTTLSQVFNDYGNPETDEENDRVPYQDVDGDNDHPLFMDRREESEESWVTQREPWNYPKLGYTSQELPVYAINETALEADNIAVGYQTRDNVRLATAGTISDRVGVHMLGTLLPPAEQRNLHPFGMDGHALTMFGYQLLCNVLGYQLEFRRSPQVGENLGSTIGPTEMRDVGGDETPTDTDTPTDTPTETATPTDEMTDTQTDTDTPDETPDETETEEADGGGPGFGITAGLAGLGGAGYLLKQRLGDEESDD